MLSPHETVVEMKVGGQHMTFMVDTGAKHSVVTLPVAPFSKKDCHYSWNHWDKSSPATLLPSLPM